jgi:hypothetical protein
MVEEDEEETGRSSKMEREHEDSDINTQSAFSFPILGTEGALGL